VKKAAFTFLLLCLGQAFAGNPASEWLMKMNDAAKSLSYNGIFVYSHEGQIETMRVVHKVGSDGIRERLYSLNGAAREIIRSEKEVWCYLPDEKMGVHEYRQSSERNFPSILPDNIERLDQLYEIKLVDRTRVADRMAQQIAVTPKDKHRYGYNLWIDIKSGLLLKAELLDIDASVIERHMFADVSIGPVVSADDLKPNTPKEKLIWFGPEASPAPEQSSSLEWSINEVPKGFEQSQRIRRVSPARKQVVEHFVYTDGLATVSIFIEKSAGAKDAMKGMSRMGAMHAFGAMVGEYQVTVVGEVPGATVSMIGKSVNH